MMITYSTENMHMNRKAITFVELMVCIIVSSLVFTVIYRFMSNTRQNYMFGTVNLQNLQDARLAINYLRRDFAASCPMFAEPSDSNGGYVNLQKVRKQLFVTQNSENLNGDLMQVHKNGLLFHKFVYGSFGEYPRVEAITYQFDATSQTLTRTSESQGVKTFAGFDEVEFGLYTHEINDKAPVLWVKFKINESSNIYGSDEIGKALELTTTISSPFINSSQNNAYWRYQTGHQK